MTVLLLSEHYPRNPYRPAHVRRTYFDTDARAFIAQATIGESILLEVTATSDLDARNLLAKRLIEVFRAMKRAA